MASTPAGKKPAPKRKTSPAAGKTAAGVAARAAKTAKPQEAKARSIGRPSDFRDEYIDQARRLCKLGATDIELADFFGVAASTIHRWRISIPDFCSSIKVGKAEADDRVERSLFARANGYEHDEVDIRVVNGDVVQTPIRKFYPPDTAAAIFWLKNRRRADWREKVDHELTGPDGGALQVASTVTFVRPPPRREDDE